MTGAFDERPESRSHTGDLPKGDLLFKRPLVLLQSDDWGRVGVRDREGFDQLQAAGVRLGENSYDLYTLESAEDVRAVHGLLLKHRDSRGLCPRLVMNFLLANLDFDATLSDDARRIHLRLLRDGLPGKWQRPGLFDAFRAGIDDDVFYPALHGLSHFCQRAVTQCAQSQQCWQLLQTFWRADTPYIYSRMPWVGYEYCSTKPAPRAGFLPAGEQEDLIRQAVKAFADFFETNAVSACAPGYRANRDTHRAWAACGIRVAQNGSGSWRAPHVDSFGLLHLYRAIDFEPAVHSDFSVQHCLALAEECFARRVPAIVSLHSINFHSSLRDSCGPTVSALDQFLSVLESRHPDLLYTHDAEILDLIERGGDDEAWEWSSPQQNRGQGCAVGAF